MASSKRFKGKSKRVKLRSGERENVRPLGESWRTYRHRKGLDTDQVTELFEGGTNKPRIGRPLNVMISRIGIHELPPAFLRKI
jgi:hypothetical protein